VHAGCQQTGVLQEKNQSEGAANLPHGIAGRWERFIVAGEHYRTAA